MRAPAKCSVFQHIFLCFPSSWEFNRGLDSKGVSEVAFQPEATLLVERSAGFLDPEDPSSPFKSNIVLS